MTEPESYVADLSAIHRVMQKLGLATRQLLRAIEADNPQVKKSACEEALSIINSTSQLTARFGKHIEAEKRMQELDDEDVDVLRERMGSADEAGDDDG